MTVRIRADHPRAAPTGPPPVFTISTNRSSCEVEITADPILFTGSLAGRRNSSNFSVSGVLPVTRGKVSYTLPQPDWVALRQVVYLYYRAIAYDGASRVGSLNLEASTTDNNYQQAPTIYIAPPGTRPPKVRRRLSGQLQWLRVDGNQVVNQRRRPGGAPGREPLGDGIH